MTMISASEFVWGSVHRVPAMGGEVGFYDMYDEYDI